MGRLAPRQKTPSIMEIGSCRARSFTLDLSVGSFDTCLFGSQGQKDRDSAPILHLKRGMKATLLSVKTSLIRNRLLESFIAVATIASLTGCGRANTIYPADENGVVSIGEQPYFPAGFTDQSVAHASVEIVRTNGQYQLRLQTLNIANTGGTFNAPTATGTRAILGIDVYKQKPLADLTLEPSFQTATSSKLQATLLVDLTCDSSSGVTTLVSEPLATDLSVTMHDSIWSSAGGAIVDSSNNTLVPASSDHAPTSLDALLATYPNACLRGALSTADELPFNRPLAALLLSIGDATTATDETLTISKLKINGDEYSSWSAQ